MPKRSNRSGFSSSITQKRETRRYLCHRRFKTILPKEEIYRKIQLAHKNKTGLNTCEIDCFLYNLPNYLGCFSQDALANLAIRSLPVSLIVNLDTSSMAGSHWIALVIRKRTIEVFDPFGFNFQKWPPVTSRILIDFLHKFALRRRVFISRDIQSVNSTLCGFYCIFFLYFRLTHSFRDCTNYFSVTNLDINDDILVDSFK